MRLRDITPLMEQATSWQGSERCWWHPLSGSVIPVGDHEEHADVFDRTFDAKASRQFLPPSVSGDLPSELSVSDVLDIAAEIGEELDFRTAPVVMGWVCVNCNPKITSLPYVLARTRQDAARCIRWLETRDCFPADHPGFSVETWSFEQDVLRFGRFKVLNGKLVAIGA